MDGYSGQRVSSKSNCQPKRHFKWDTIKKSKLTILERLVQDSLPTDFDQPIDMSLSSRKRALSPVSMSNSITESVPKKLRPTSTTNTETRRKRRKPLRNLAAAESTTSPTFHDNVNNKKSRTALIISPEEYSDEGINNHFRRSLSKYIVDSDIGFPEREVDEHFLRSLGWEVWWKLLSQAKPRQNPYSSSVQIRPTVLVLDKK